ncbi:YbaK family protein [Bacillus halotolerans]|uniref:YbaK family protein n=1 Tax=Bacillus halotolerans TaxID=260554 RepID=UPI001D0ED7BF|nr:YbaK family protein [Bacillus halotolerans]MCC2529736.1 YbaK family protein [Bacillus halotolerans]
MAEVLSFMDMKRQKDFELEKNLLKELSLRQIIQSVKACLTPLFPFLQDERDVITEGCIDFAIEAYLLGGRFGVFGYYGESMQSVSARSAREEEELRMEFFEYLYHWTHEQYATFDKNTVYEAARKFIKDWWTEGFVQREKQCKLRMR